MKVSTENDNNFGYEKITIVVDNIPLKYVTIVNQNGESSKSTKRKTTDHQQEKIKEYEKNRTRTFLPKWAVGRPWLLDEANGMVCKAGLEPTPYW
jgi:hypothetical protein